MPPPNVHLLVPSILNRKELFHFFQKSCFVSKTRVFPNFVNFPFLKMHFQLRYSYICLLFRFFSGTVAFVSMKLKMIIIPPWQILMIFLFGILFYPFIGIFLLKLTTNESFFSVSKTFQYMFYITRSTVVKRQLGVRAFQISLPLGHTTFARFANLFRASISTHCFMPHQ